MGLKHKELECIDTYKVILMVIIVFYHCTSIWSEGWLPFEVKGGYYFVSILNYITFWLNTVHIYGFVFASGYLFYYLRYELGKYRNGKADIKKRATRLLVPYAIISLFWCIPLNCVLYDYSAAEVVKRFVLAVSPSQLWFIVMLFNVYFIYYFISDRLFSKGIISGLVFLYIVNFAGAMLLSASGAFNIFQIGVALKYLFFFHIGALFRKCSFKNNGWKAFLMLLISLMGSFLAYKSMLDAVLVRLIMPIVSVCGVLSTFGIVSGLNKYINKDNKLYCLLKKYSMAVYLIHQQIIQFFAKLLNNFDLHEFIMLFGIFVLAITISLLISATLSKFSFGRTALGIK